MRFGIIGSNFIVQQFLDAARLCEEFTLTTVYSRSLAKAQSLAQQWGAPCATDSLTALAQSSEVDAVYLASPNVCHAPQAIQMLRAGKHVLCEKPIARDTAQLQEMLQVAKENGVLLVEAMRPAYLPTRQLILDTLPRLGTVRRVQLSYCQYSSRYDKFKQGVVENAFDPTLYNGALMDIGVYCVHWMTMLFGKPKKICAMGEFLPQSIDAYGSVLCAYDGMHVQLSYSKVHQSHTPSAIEGELGTLYFAPTPTPYDAWIVWKDGTKEALPLTVCRDDMLYELQAFIAMANTGTGAAQAQADSLLALQVMDEIRRQIKIDFTMQ